MATLEKKGDLVVYGYIRLKIKKTISSSIPNEITQIIFLFYPKKYQIFGIGSNDRGQLGLLPKVKRTMPWGALTKWTDLDSIEQNQLSSFIDDPDQIYRGTHRFTLLHYNKLSVYSIGFNDHGQCGTTNPSSNTQPNQWDGGMQKFMKMSMTHFKFDQNEKIKLISNGHVSTLFLTNKSKLYACGNNGSGQFGNGRFHGYQYNSNDGPIPIILDDQLKTIWNKENIIKIEMGFTHTLVLSKSGSVWVTGDNQRGQIGLNTNIRYKTKFERIEFNFEHKVIDIACGQMHSLCVTDKHNLIVFGRNDVK